MCGAPAELGSYLRGALGEALAGSKVNGTPAQRQVVDQTVGSDKGLGLGTGSRCALRGSRARAYPDFSGAIVREPPVRGPFPKSKSGAMRTHPFFMRTEVHQNEAEVPPLPAILDCRTCSESCRGAAPADFIKKPRGDWG